MTEALLAASQPAYTLRQLVGYFLRLGATGFGGPVALVEHMRRDLVDGRSWIDEADYREGLALAQLAPGPLAAQLAIYIGYIHYRIRGATLAGLAFVFPSFLMVVALGWAYVTYGGLPWMKAVFYGVSASVIGIIAWSAYKLTTRSLGKDRLLWGIALIAAALTVVTESEQIELFLLAGVLVWLVKAPPKIAWLKARLLNLSVLPLSVVALNAPALADNQTLIQIFTFFAKAGAFVFGSGLAIVPFLYSGVVNEHHWLTDAQFVDAVAVAMITPGPVVITVGFIGYLVAAFPGAALAALGTFLPCYLFTIIPAPYFKRFGKRPDIAAFVQGITAAAIGAICGAVLVLGRRTLDDPATILIALITLTMLWKIKRIPEPVIVLGAALVGLVIHPLVGG